MKKFRNFLKLLLKPRVLTIKILNKLVSVSPTAINTVHVLSNNNGKTKIGKQPIYGINSVIINDGGVVEIGDNFKTGIGANLLSYGGSIRIGKNVLINNYSIVYGNGGVIIGDNTQIAAHCVVIPANHISSRTDIPISRQGETRKGIKIGNDVWVGSNVTILDGVEIGDGSIIGAGSVVTKSIPPFTVAFGVPAKVVKERVNSDKIDFKSISLSLIDFIYGREKENNSELINKILSFKSPTLSSVLVEERGFPGDPEFQVYGYYNIMLKRYFFAGALFGKDKKILDSCCGFGWGTYILSQYSTNVCAFDLDKTAVEFNKKTWVTDAIKWRVGNALDLTFLGEEKFQVVTAFETIEHFTKDDGEKYISQLALVLEQGGVLIGSSTFPNSATAAKALCEKNPHHLYIFTEEEISKILGKYFQEFKVINNWLIIARK